MLLFLNFLFTVANQFQPEVFCKPLRDLYILKRENVYIIKIMNPLTICYQKAWRTMQYNLDVHYLFAFLLCNKKKVKCLKHQKISHIKAPFYIDMWRIFINRKNFEI